MSNTCLKILEYKTQSINQDGGFKLSQKEVDRFVKFNNELKIKQKVNGDVIVFKYHHGQAISITASSYVGVIKVGNKTIQIIPKLAEDTNDSSDKFSDQSIKNLFYLLNYTKRLKIKETNLASLKQSNDDFFEVLIYLFANNLLEMTRRRVNKQYIRQEDNLTFIKGKLQINAHVKQNSVNRHKFYLEFDEFCEDNLINQIFKYAVTLLLRASKSFNNLKLLQELNFIFSDISYKQIKADDFSKINFNRLNQDFEPLLNLCRIFIIGSSLELSSDKITTFSFIFDMNALFEEFIGEFLKRNFYDKYDRISLQRPIRWLVEDKFVGSYSEGKLFQLRPDIQLFNKTVDNEPSIIIDTKYKILNDDRDKKEGVSQSDLYQMNAYSKKFNCKNIILLYPQLDGQDAKNVKLVIDDNTEVFVRTVNLFRDLKNSKSELVEELKQVLNI